MYAVICREVVKGFAKYGFHLRRKPGAQRTLALKGVSFEVTPGETFGILGANGSGKSTLIRVIATLLLPDSGQVEVFGRSAVHDPEGVRTLIHRVSVEAAFIKKLSAWENLLFGSRLYGLKPDDVRTRGTEILERLGFPLHKMGESLENLSRGQQQKVAIARAMLVRPRLLLLDEPTTGLDPLSRRQVQTYLRDIQAQEGVTTLLTTHDMQEAERLCQRVAIMKEGEIVALGTPQALAADMQGGHHANPTLEDVFIKLQEEEVNPDVSLALA